MKSSSNLFKDKLSDAFSKQSNVQINSDTMGDYTNYINAMEQEETKEATGASSAGSYSGPIFTKEGEDTDKIKGGLSKGMSLMDVAKKHTKDKFAKTQSKERIEKMYDHLRILKWLKKLQWIICSRIITITINFLRYTKKVKR